MKEYLSNRIPLPPDPISMFRVEKPLANSAMAKTCLAFSLHGPYDPENRVCEYVAPTRRPRFSPKFLISARGLWPAFFRNAKEHPQLLALAIEYLTAKHGHSLDGNLDSAMTLASREGLDSVIAWFIEHHSPDIDMSKALLQVCSSRFRSIETVKVLVEHCAAVNGLRFDTPLLEAARRKDVRLFQTLVQLGADLRQKNTFGETPVFEAAINFCPSLELIELMWCPDSSFSHDIQKRNILHLIAGLPFSCPPIENVARWLIDHGVDPYHIDDRGYTPLHIAVENRNESAIEVLIAATGKNSGYDGCLMRYFQSTRHRTQLSTAQQIFSVDPNPTGDFGRGGGALFFLLLDICHDLDRSSCCPGTLFYARKINELLLECEEDYAPIGADLYVQLLEVLLKNPQPMTMQ